MQLRSAGGVWVSSPLPKITVITEGCGPGREEGKKVPTHSALREMAGARRGGGEEIIRLNRMPPACRLHLQRANPVLRRAICPTVRDNVLLLVSALPALTPGLKLAAGGACATMCAPARQSVISGVMDHLDKQACITPPTQLACLHHLHAPLMTPSPWCERRCSIDLLKPFPIWRYLCRHGLVLRSAGPPLSPFPGGHLGNGGAPMIRPAATAVQHPAARRASPIP